MWEEIILIFEFFSETAQVSSQSIFTGQIIHAKEMIHSLVAVHLRQEIWVYSKVLPLDFPRQLSIRKLTSGNDKILSSLLVICHCLERVFLWVVRIVVNRWNNQSETKLFQAQSSEDFVFAPYTKLKDERTSSLLYLPVMFTVIRYGF